MGKGVVTTTVSGITDPGSIRTFNEDSLLISEPDTNSVWQWGCRIVRPYEKNNLLLAVADGTGGYQYGDVASQMTVSTILSALVKLPKQLSPFSRLEAAVEEANHVVWQYYHQIGKAKKLSATATVMLVEQDIAYFAEVGDSRAYILRENRIKQITKDQTMKQVLIDTGKLTPEQAAETMKHSVLLQSIGNQEFLQVAVNSIQLQAGDIFLLCSDGLSNLMAADDMKKIIGRDSRLDATAYSLVEEAKRLGSEDNITVILAKFEGLGLSANVPGASITNRLQTLLHYDPLNAVAARPKRQVRDATFQDWLDSGVVNAFARAEEQYRALSALGEYGDLITFRKEDLIDTQTEETATDHYWLVKGRFGMLAETEPGERRTIAIFVPATDRRNRQEISGNAPGVLVRHQFFFSNFGKLRTHGKNLLIRCEDEENSVIRIKWPLFQKITAILGERYAITVNYS